MRAFLQGAPLFLLFGVTAVGYLLGTLRVAGFSLGVAAVLFAGLFFGWLLPGVALPEFVAQLGLVLFVYTIGIASGPGFFSSLRRRGLRDNGLVLIVLAGAWTSALLLARLVGLGGAAAAGVFSGALNNAPALAAVSESLRAAGAPAAAISQSVLAFSLTYPLGVLLPLGAVAASARLLPGVFSQGRVSRAYGGDGDAPLVNATIHVDHPPARTAHELKHTQHGSVAFGRVQRSAVTSIVDGSARFQVGDRLTVVGNKASVDAVTALLGHTSPEHLELERSEVTFRRILVSNPKVTELPLRELALPQRYGAVITRVRRGDVDITPHGNFELLLGDRARVVAPLNRIQQLNVLLGDSARRVAEVDLITFGLGIALGLLVGAIPVPLPGGAHFSLGSAGGPLVMGLVLGRLGRSGPLVWTPPYSANMTLRQLGLVLFLAGIGLRAGASLAQPGECGGWLLVVAGASVTSVVVLLSIFVGYRLLKIPLAVLVGSMAGIQTQPAVLAFALEQTNGEQPNVGYASVFPLAMIGKIVLAQLALQCLPWH